ncbi:hypothetical protein [Streptomyces sp. NPDC089915]|uniref:hypothetical protein n=1 Tax=Streptomyces sp. NPDC089915 TaxID=3155186 RepID=UPI0034225944
MRRTAVTFAGLAAVTAALVGGCGGAASGPAAPAPLPTSGAAAPPCPGVDRPATAAPPTTVGGTPENTPEAARLSQAVGAQGRGAFADVYGSHVTDQPPGRVALCVTDLARGRKLLEAARKADPAVDPGRADLYLSRYTRRALNQAVGRLTADRARPQFPLYSFSAASDASGVLVTSTDGGVASKELKAHLEQLTGGVPVTVERGDPLTAAVGDPSAGASDPAP